MVAQSRRCHVGPHFGMPVPIPPGTRRMEEAARWIAAPSLLGHGAGVLRCTAAITIVEAAICLIPPAVPGRWPDHPRLPSRMFMTAELVYPEQEHGLPYIVYRAARSRQQVHRPGCRVRAFGAPGRPSLIRRCDGDRARVPPRVRHPRRRVRTPFVSEPGCDVRARRRRSIPPSHIPSSGSSALRANACAASAAFLRGDRRWRRVWYDIAGKIAPRAIFPCFSGVARAWLDPE